MATLTLPTSNLFFVAPSSSVAGLLNYLNESNPKLQLIALEKLYPVLDIHWSEICEYLPQLEALSEDVTFVGHELAAAIASKCFYHLQEYEDALRVALSAGKYFDLTIKSEYIDTMLSICIDQYKSLRLQQVSVNNNNNGTTTTGTADEAVPANNNSNNNNNVVVIDPRMESLMEQMFQRCYNDSCFEQAMGIALDTHRLDKVEEICVKAIQNNNNTTILNYTFQLCQTARNITLREFRLNVISVLIKCYRQLLQRPDYANVCYGYQYLNNPVDVTETLQHLIRGSMEETLQDYQICFDLQEAENQGFILQIVQAFTPVKSSTVPAPSVPAPTTTTATGGGDDDTENSEASPLLGNNNNSGSNSSNNNTVEEEDLDTKEYNDRMSKLKRILLEGFDIDLILNFLFKQCKADINILKTIKTTTETSRSTIVHNAVVVAHSYMYAGTTIDLFLRENLEWLSKATNWNKFTAVASIGVVHKGHVHESMNLLQPYLPQQQQGYLSTSPYSESGALYALGLIHANKGGCGDATVINYLTEALHNSGNNEIVQHGCCLGLGLAAMATATTSLYEDLRSTLYLDNAVAAEGAAFAIGLIMVGQSDSILAQSEIPNLLNAAHDSTHEKMVRALSLGIAMMVYGKEESGDVLIEQLLRDRDPIIRYGGCYAIAMAYCGTNDNNAIRKLLHIAVSDVSDDVRRAAVTSVGFVSFRQPELVPKLVLLLAQSFNPHVRYGACMAIGIACCGQANKEAIDILTPMLEDQVDFVRQGAFIAMAFVLQQTTETRSVTVKKFRDLITSTIADKHQTLMTKTGAILAAGIIDAGGRNVMVSLQSRAGFLKIGAAIGMLLFCQYWHWYPLMHMLSLAFQPTMLIGLNHNFDIPKSFVVVCHAPPSMFNYPKIESKKEEEKKVVTTAVLSTTVKAKAREARKEARKLGRQNSFGSMHTTDKEKDNNNNNNNKENKENKESKEGAGEGGPGPSLERVTSYLSTTSYISTEEIKLTTAAEEANKNKKEKEPSSFIVHNPSRVVPSQIRFLSLPRVSDDGEDDNNNNAMAVDGEAGTATTTKLSTRYLPVDVTRRVAPSGIVMLLDEDFNSNNGNNNNDDLVEKVERIRINQSNEEEAAMPEPFLWDPNDE